MHRCGAAVSRSYIAVSRRVSASHVSVQACGSRDFAHCGEVEDPIFELRAVKLAEGPTGVIA